MRFQVFAGKNEVVIDIPAADNELVPSLFRPAFVVDYIIRNGKGTRARANYYEHIETGNLYSESMIASEKKHEFNGYEEVGGWLQKNFTAKVKMAPGLSQNQKELLGTGSFRFKGAALQKELERIAEETFKNFAIIDKVLFIRREEPMYTIGADLKHPSVSVEHYNVARTPFQFRYDELPLIMPYLESIEGEKFDTIQKEGIAGTPTEEVNEDLEDYNIRIMDGYESKLLSRDSRIMDWLERNIKLVLKANDVTLPDSDIYALMKRAIAENGGTNFCKGVSVEQLNAWMTVEK